MIRPIPLLAGAALAAVTGLLMVWLPPRHGLELAAVILGAAAAVYAGSALREGRRAVVRLETGAALVVGGLAVLGLWVSVGFLVAGYVLHGLWDQLHHPHRIGARAGSTFPTTCLVYHVAGILAARYGW